MATCRRCGRKGSSQFSSDFEPGLYCTNLRACRRRQEADEKRAQAAPTEEEA